MWPPLLEGVLVALGDTTPKPFPHLLPCPWSIAEALNARLGATSVPVPGRPGLRVLSHSIGVSWCRFDLQLPALARSLPFLPPGTPWEGVGDEITASVTLCHRRAALTPWLHPQKPSTTQVWGSSSHSQRDWDQPQALVGKSCMQPSQLRLGMGSLHPKSLGMGGDVLTSASLAGPGLPGSRGCAPSSWPRSSPTSPCPSSSASSPACSPKLST